ncbi:MAG: thioredoxin domain-containing protein [Henriciella sp.]|nr:thioredoxin domain-containing protein [Henriciella sp.]
MNHKLAAAFTVTAIALTPACAQEDRVSTADKEAIEQIVSAYIMEHPQIIEDALIKLSEQREQANAALSSEKIMANFDAIYKNESDYSIGPADAPITVVEFFDYRCGFCKRSAEWALQLPEKYDGKVRVVFKELPILSPESEKAALAAVAAGKQGKYIEMHMALMRLDNNTGFGPAEIDKAAVSVGVDVTLMRADMKSLAVQTTVSKSKSLARTLGIDGTPNFMIGLQQVAGADTDRVEDYIDAELEKLS